MSAASLPRQMTEAEAEDFCANERDKLFLQIGELRDRRSPWFYRAITDDPRPPAASGVYFLWKDGNLQYVGKATNIATRIVDHFFSSKDFDSVSWVLCPRELCTRLEDEYLAAFQPPLNKVW